MADTKWTKEQERAISDRGKGIIVSAAAGSGKTTVLIERMIQLLSDEKNKIPADRLLAVTFTKEAASNMKEKLSRAFDEQLRRDPENKWLLSQQNLIQLARISTINSFCLDLVKSNLHEFDYFSYLNQRFSFSFNRVGCVYLYSDEKNVADETGAGTK